jgi:hypothetical protein
MNTTPEYTDEQIQTAIDAAFAKPTINVTLSTRSYKEEFKDQCYTRLAIARAFLAALSEPTQEEKWQAEFEVCFPDFDLTKQKDGGYLHAHAAMAWRAFLAAKKGGAK